MDNVDIFYLHLCTEREDLGWGYGKERNTPNSSNECTPLETFLQLMLSLRPMYFCFRFLIMEETRVAEFSAKKAFRTNFEKCLKPESRTTRNREKLRLIDLSGAFLVLGIGVTLSSLIFLGEIFIWKKNSTRTTVNNR